MWNEQEGKRDLEKTSMINVVATVNQACKFVSTCSLPPVECDLHMWT